jgi:hypothetical protein
MSSPLRVSSKSKLADALGIARVTLYQYCRLPDSPPVRNGYYYVADWRKFITKKRNVMETSEKQQLQLQLLKTKLQREQHCLGEARQATRQKLVEELQTELHAIFTQHITGLRRLMDMLPP